MSTEATPIPPPPPTENTEGPRLPFPPEIWLRVATFLPIETIESLHSVNRTFFNLVMESRWKCVVVSTIEANTSLKSYERLLRLADPDIRKYVQLLKITDTIWEKEKSHGYGLWRTTEYVNTRLLGYQLPASADKGKTTLHKVDVEKLRELALKAVLMLTEVVSIEIALDGVEGGVFRYLSKPTADSNPVWTSGPLIGSGATTMVHRRKFLEWVASLTRRALDMPARRNNKTKSIRISGNPQNFRSFLKPMATTCRIEDLHLTVDGQSSPADGEAFLNITLRAVASLAPTLKTLKLVYAEGCTMELSSFLLGLPRFPLLKSFTLRASFNVAFANELKGRSIFDFLKAQAKTLQYLDLHLSPDDGRDVHLSTWISRVLRSAWIKTSAVHDLKVAATDTAEERAAITEYVGRCGGGISKLDIGLDYWTTEQLTALLDVLPRDGAMMRYLRIGVEMLSATLLDVLAERMWWIHHLCLQVKIVGRGGVATKDVKTLKTLFLRDVKKKSYGDWRLRHFEIVLCGSDGREEESVLRESIPSAVVLVSRRVEDAV